MVPEKDQGLIIYSFFLFGSRPAGSLGHHEHFSRCTQPSSLNLLAIAGNTSGNGESSILVFCWCGHGNVARFHFLKAVPFLTRRFCFPILSRVPFFGSTRWSGIGLPTITLQDAVCAPSFSVQECMICDTLHNLVNWTTQQHPSDFAHIVLIYCFIFQEISIDLFSIELPLLSFLLFFRGCF